MDRYVPLISNLNVQGDLELGSTVTLSVDLNTPFAGSGLSDMDDAARVEYQIGTQRLMVSEAAPYSVSFPLILADLNAESKLSVVATVYDQAQN